MDQKTSQPQGSSQMVTTPPPAAYGSPQPQMPAPVIVHASPITGLGALPAIIDCPFCHQRTQTRIVEENSSMTILAGIGLGCLCICIACLPCILHWCQDVDHYCGSCNQKIAHIPYNGVPQVVSPPPATAPSMGTQQQYAPQQQQQMQQNQPPQY